MIKVKTTAQKQKKSKHKISKHNSKTKFYKKQFRIENAKNI